MVLVCFGTAKQAILVFGKQQAARASDSHELTHEGAAAGCLIKGYERTTEQSLGLWDTCLELLNQSNESSLCHYFHLHRSRFLAGDLGIRLGQRMRRARTSKRRRTMPTPATTAALAGRGVALLLRSSCGASALALSRVMETGTCCASREITVHHGIAGNAAGKRTGFADRVGRQRRSVSTLVLLYVQCRAFRLFVV